MSGLGVSLLGIDDAALRSTMADFVTGLGATVVSDRASTSAELVLVLVASPEQLADRVAGIRARLPRASAVVLVPFSQPPLSLRALALGAAACHGMDQPMEHLSAVLRGLLQMEASGAGRAG